MSRSGGRFRYLETARTPRGPWRFGASTNETGSCDDISRMEPPQLLTAAATSQVWSGHKRRSDMKSYESSFTSGDAAARGGTAESNNARRALSERARLVWFQSTAIDDSALALRTREIAPAVLQRRAPLVVSGRPNFGPSCHSAFALLEAPKSYGANTTRGARDGSLTS